MRIGAIFPQTEIGTDPAAIADYARALEEAGAHHLLVYEHVLGVDADKHPEYAKRYNHRSVFHEPFVLFGYLAGLTRKIEFTFGVLVLPMRQTALVAKQAATLDVLSGGRVRMAVGVGWNRMEHEAMGAEFATRGRRIEEQIALLRELWTRELVSFDGRWHRLHDVGINPLPVQRPIPLWMGGHDDRVMRRAARLADGWMPTFGRKATPDEKRAAIVSLRGYLRDAGRDPEAFGLEGRAYFGDGGLPDLLDQAREWQSLGATHLSINTMNAGLRSADEHAKVVVELLREWGD